MNAILTWNSSDFRAAGRTIWTWPRRLNLCFLFKEKECKKAEFRTALINAQLYFSIHLTFTHWALGAALWLSTAVRYNVPLFCPCAIWAVPKLHANKTSSALMNNTSKMQPWLPCCCHEARDVSHSPGSDTHYCCSKEMLGLSGVTRTHHTPG